jgi:hypothetical protein
MLGTARRCRGVSRRRTLASGGNSTSLVESVIEVTEGEEDRVGIGVEILDVDRTVGRVGEKAVLFLKRSGDGLSSLPGSVSS